MSNRAVSVVIPAWDSYVNDNLVDAVRSVQQQDGNLTVLLVDNASRRPVPSLDEARLISVPERLTLGEARNVGLEAVATPWVLFWDADDIMLHGAVVTLLDAVGQHPDAVVGVMAITEGPESRPHRWPPPWASRVARWPRLFALANGLWSLYPTIGSLLRTDSVRDAGGFPDANYGDDWALGVSLAFRGRVVFTDRPGRWYRRYATSLSRRRGYLRFFIRSAAVARRRFCADPGIPGWARAMRPVVPVTQIVLVAVVRPLVGFVRGMRSRLGVGGLTRSRTRDLM